MPNRGTKASDPMPSIARHNRRHGRSDESLQELALETGRVGTQGDWPGRCCRGRRRRRPPVVEGYRAGDSGRRYGHLPSRRHAVVGIILVYCDAPPPRPNFIQLRWSLLYDAVHTRSASAEQPAEGTGPLGERHAQSPHMDNFRHSAHWRPAVWGVRVMCPGLAVVIAGLVTLLWSTATGQAILTVGIGIYLVGVALTLVEVRWAYGEVQPPRPNYARVQRTLLHDPLHARS
jgi:hypothetical protein